MTSFYPLKFIPIFKYRIWGGEKLKNILNKDVSDPNIGESWEISQVPGDISVVSDGVLKGNSLTKLINQYGPKLLGKEVFSRFGQEFPLLIKFIDTRENCSIQVHPSDIVARERHNSFEKNEMWYVMQADTESKLLVGWEKPIDSELYVNSVSNGTILDYVHSETVTKGDAFYIPTGRIHAIGAGTLIAEIQQTSDVTYRVYDYDRIDAKTGQKRDLHIDQAKDVLDYSIQETCKTQYHTAKNQSKELVHSPYFKTNIIDLEDEMVLDYSLRDSFTIFIIVEGNLSVNNLPFSCGETVLIPNALNEVSLKGKSKLLEVSM
jgi:mannose-6-phosphate isomerase